MPIENERKYVLDPRNPEKYKAQLERIPGSVTYDFSQGYLGNKCRIRKSIKCIEGKPNISCSMNQYWFTYKNVINHHVIEIETEISAEDFKNLWIQAQKIITKTRVVVPHESQVWEVDFFKASNVRDFYLVMAEIELPPDIQEPCDIPKFITDHLLYSVEPCDSRFRNENLSKVRVVQKIINGIKNDSI